MKYVFHPAALTEYGEAVEFYAERRVALAQAFINAVEDAIFCFPVSEDSVKEAAE